jgi:hypothetical protein
MTMRPDSGVGDGGRFHRLATRRLAVGAAVPAVLVVVIVGAWAAGVFSSSGTSPALVIKPAVVPSFPAPPPGAVVLAAEDGTNALGLAVTPGTRRIAVQASVIAALNTTGVPGLDLRFRIDTGQKVVTGRGVACGAGCYRADIASGWPKSVAVVIAGHRPQSLSFALPARANIKPGAQIVARAERVWRSLDSVVDHDSLSDGHATVHTLWRIVAPDKVAYVVQGGGSSVIIGDRIWEKAEGGSLWTEQPQSPLKQPVPFWSKAVDAHVVGSVSLDGHPAWKVTFFDPSTPGWYAILVDKATSHTVSVDMTATAHFMHDEYSGFDTPLSITPPRNVAGG